MATDVAAAIAAGIPILVTAEGGARAQPIEVVLPRPAFRRVAKRLLMVPPGCRPEQRRRLSVLERFLRHVCRFKPGDIAPVLDHYTSVLSLIQAVVASTSTLPAETTAVIRDALQERAVEGQRTRAAQPPRGSHSARASVQAG